MIRVAIFEDNKHLRETFQFLLMHTEGFTCAGAYPDCNNILNDIQAQPCDVVLMDIEMPHVNGIEGLALIKRHYPEIKILMQTVFEQDDKIFDAIRAGADGYLLKKTPPAKIIDAISELLAGGAPMTPTVARQVLQLFNGKNKNPRKDFSLTQRELEILTMLVQGLSYKMIAEKCHVSYSTVNTHISHIYEKLHVKSGTEAVAMAIEQQLV